MSGISTLRKHTFADKPKKGGEKEKACTLDCVVTEIVHLDLTL